MLSLLIMHRRLELVVFIGGAVGMVLELIGSRVLAPFFGNTLFVWTGLIGVILGSMSLGYHFGGKLADKKKDMITLSGLLFGASVFVLFSAVFKEQVLTLIVSLFRSNLKIASLLSILILFGPASVILGCVSPYAAGLKVKSVEKTGSVVGNLYALSTMGSITGTFLAGYYLIPTFGNSTLLYLLAMVLLSLSVLSSLRLNSSTGVMTLSILLLFLANNEFDHLKLNVLEDVDSLYNRILIRKVESNDKTTITLSTENRGTQSAVYPEFPNILVSDYTNAYRIGGLIMTKIDNALMLGGAGFVYPRYFLENNLGNRIDVVEIDAKMIELARKHFFLKDDPRLNIYIDDARLFTKEVKNEYDVIYLDAFSSINPPYHLTTVEFLSELKESLTEDGILMVNLISSTSGLNSQFLNIEGNTLKKVFGKVDLFIIQERSASEIQNLMVVAYKGVRPKELVTDDKALAQLIKERYRLEDKLKGDTVLTDDYAPVEHITRSMYDSSN